MSKERDATYTVIFASAVAHLHLLPRRFRCRTPAGKALRSAYPSTISEESFRTVTGRQEGGVILPVNKPVKSITARGLRASIASPACDLP